MVLEPLVIEIAGIDGDGLGAQVAQQAREPRLEHRRPLPRRRRPARVRSRRDVEDPFAPHTRERPERRLDTPDELFEDRGKLWLPRDLARQIVTLVQLLERAREKLALGARPSPRQQTIAKCAVHYRVVMARSSVRALSRGDLLRIYAKPKTIAVVGASDTRGKPAHDIPLYLKSQGYTIIPVNPRGGEILGEPAFASLREVNSPIDIVEVFRPPDEAERVAREAVAVGARVLWFQPDTESDEALRAVADSDITVVTRRCMGVTHGLLGLGPGPHPRK